SPGRGFEAPMEYLNTLLIQTGFHVLLGLSVYTVALTGQISFGQQGFYAIGAYIAAIATTLWGVPLLPALLLGTVVSACFGFLVGFPALRVRGLYLAIATFAFGEIVRLGVLNLYYTRQVGGAEVGPVGPEGFRHISYFTDHGWTTGNVLLLVAVVVCVVLAFYAVIERSRLGATIRAVGADELAASMVGIRVVWVKVGAFAIGGGIAGLGGGLYAHYTTFLSHQAFGLPVAVIAVAYALVGGLGSFAGPVAGVVFFLVLTEGLRFLGEYRMLIYGAVVVLAMNVRPHGLVDETVVHRIKNLVSSGPGAPKERVDARP
ncbi:MAG: branched-chain amino acid ABC transporter permease, partial [Paracoccaceae bacterium]